MVNYRCKKGARSIESISLASKLPAKSPKKYNFSRISVRGYTYSQGHYRCFAPFLKDCILVTELRRMDGIDRCTSLDRTKARNVTEYEFFLQNTCKIPFRFYICQDLCSLKWRDLSGPEKYKLFWNVDLTNLFPNLPNMEIVQRIWTQFLLLNESIRSESLSPAEICLRFRCNIMATTFSAGVPNQMCDTICDRI